MDHLVLDEIMSVVAIDKDHHIAPINEVVDMQGCGNRLAGQTMKTNLGKG